VEVGGRAHREGDALRLAVPGEAVRGGVEDRQVPGVGVVLGAEPGAHAGLDVNGDGQRGGEGGEGVRLRPAPCGGAGGDERAARDGPLVLAGLPDLSVHRLAVGEEAQSSFALSFQFPVFSC